MTKASTKRVANRVSKKQPKASEPSSDKSNGDGAEQQPAASAQAQLGEQPPPTKKVADLKASEKKSLMEIEQSMMRKMAQIGDITMQIDAAKRQQAALSDEVMRLRQERASAMKQIVISHGFDPDKRAYQLMLDKSEIHTRV